VRTSSSIPNRPHSFPFVRTNSKDTVLDDGDSNITYTGNWGDAAGSGLASSYFQSTFQCVITFLRCAPLLNIQFYSRSVTNTKGDTATIKFDGNAIAIYGAVSNNHGPFSVSLDGAEAVQLTGQAWTFYAQTLLVCPHPRLSITQIG
jgi:hypothetical protein